MNKVAGWAVGGAVLSITVGVLVGVVLHAGQLERADRLQPAAIPTQSAASSPASTRSTPAISPSSSTVVTWLPPSTPGTPPTEDAVTTGVATDQPPDTTTSMTPSSATVATSDTAGVSVSSTPATGTGATGTATTASGTVTAPQPGADIAGAPCPKLAAASSDAAGTTLFCQVDQKDRTLRWRAVVDGGGCLSRTMTGYAADGRLYLCRLDDSGLNHWAAAS